MQTKHPEDEAALAVFAPLLRLAVGVLVTGAALIAHTGASADEVSAANSFANTPAAVISAATPAITVTAPVLTRVSLAPQMSSPVPADASVPAGAKSFLSGVATKASDVVVGALNMIGVRYRWGGNTPDSGLDCSGFVRYVFQDTLGLTLPRRAEEMSRVGAKVSLDNLKPGDLVFFNTMRRNMFSHVGIYIGDNKFVHSPSTGSTIRVDEMDNGYWEKRLSGARRVDVAFRPDSPEQAELFRMIKSVQSGGDNAN